MKLTNHLQLPRPAKRFYRLQPVFLVVVAVLLQGCAEKQVHVRPWAAAIAIRPNLPGPAPDAQPDSLAAAAPDLSLELPSLPSPLSLKDLRQCDGEKSDERHSSSFGASVRDSRGRCRRLLFPNQIKNWR